MKKLLLSLLIVASALAFGADNEIFVEQAGATANIDLEQLGSGISREHDSFRFRWC